MTHALIPAAGRGERFGGRTKKQFLALCGLPVIVHTLTLFQNAPLIDEIVCILPKEDISYFEPFILKNRLTKVKRVIPGGGRRQDSVRAGISLLEEGNDPDDLVLVHDGVRPLAPRLLIERVVRAAQEFGAAVAALPVSDSLKEVSTEGVIKRTLPRENVWAMQTPQVFRLGLLAQAYRRAERDHFLGTDEAALVERLGFPIHCVEGSPENIKITTPWDLKMAEWRLQERRGNG